MSTRQIYVAVLATLFALTLVAADSQARQA